MDATNGVVEISVIVPARNEEENIATCLQSLVGQTGVSYEIVVVDDHSSDRTRLIAESFPVRVIEADPLAAGWSGKCNACWSGAKATKGKWLLFTDADTRHTSQSIATGLREAQAHGAALLSYSPKQEVGSFAERAVMPVIFAELAVTFRPKEVSDPGSPVAAANGQYLLMRREAYDAVGGHAAVADAMLEDVELARRVKRAGYRLQFRLSDVVHTRMYRNFSQMWEGWTKNLALLFPNARQLAVRRGLEFGLIAASTLIAAKALVGRERAAFASSAVVDSMLLIFFYRRLRRAHFDCLSNFAALFGLPLFAALLLCSDISHKHGVVEWKGRIYGNKQPATSN
jgi:cellulose synthase/poly-beta-1,6-N-acetylglucosamine synthase-like glycosyltransferase